MRGAPTLQTQQCGRLVERAEVRVKQCRASIGLGEDLPELVQVTADPGALDESDLGEAVELGEPGPLARHPIRTERHA